MGTASTLETKSALRVWLVFLFVCAPLMGQLEDMTRLPCADCHSRDSWYPLAVDRNFDHVRTAFPLTGAHLMAECVQCHPGRTNDERHAFHEADANCTACHLDIHQGVYAWECSECHTTTNWDLAQNRFDHDRTLFALNGAHRQVECEVCHVAGVEQGGMFLSTDCIVCHKSEYIAAVTNGHQENEDCAFCHNSRAWIPVDMSHHDDLFPIFTGKHRGEWSTCTAECHINPSDYKEFSCGLNGVCHEHDRGEMDAEHRGEVNDYIYESLACYDCHPRGDGD